MCEELPVSEQVLSFDGVMQGKQGTCGCGRVGCCARQDLLGAFRLKSQASWLVQGPSALSFSIVCVRIVCAAPSRGADALAAQ